MITLSYPEGCALVAGGTGRVGLGVARRIAEAGVPTIFTYRTSAEAATRLEAELRAAGHTCWARQMEMTDDASVEAAIAFAEEVGGRLHTVLVPAGAPVPFNRLADFTPAEVDAFFAGDALAFFRVVHKAIPVLRRHGGGSLVLCSTYALRRVIDFDGISPFSKGAVDAMVRQIAAEEAPHGIRCNGVGISFVVPESMAQFTAALPPDPGAGRDVTTPDAMLANLVNRVAGWTRNRRPATPDEAGDLFAYLASDQASYVSGQVIVIDGGAAL